MALVSYVDILEVVGELGDFRNKLMEGENIANLNSITEANIIRYDDFGWEVLAKCQAQVDDLSADLLSVCICCTAQPRNLKCSCSCNHEVLGKCKHVLAVLIFLHRNNQSIAKIEAEVHHVQSVENIEPLHNMKPAINDEPQTTNWMSQRSLKVTEDEVNSTTIVNGSVRASGRGPESIEDVLRAKEESNVEDISTSRIFLHHDNDEMDFEDDSLVQEASSDEDIPLLDRRKMLTTITQKTQTIPSETGKHGTLDSSTNTQGRDDTNLQDSYSGRTTADCTVPGDEPEGFGKSHRCETCGETFDRKESLVKHQCRHTYDGSKSIRESAAECPTPGDLSEGAVKSFPCETCGKTFSKKGSWATHQRSHVFRKLRDITSSCDTCGKKFSRKIHYDEHLDKCKGPAEQETACKECGKTFSCRSSRDAHQRAHQKERTGQFTLFTCEVCGKGFRKSFQLHLHKKMHDPSQFQCTKCGKCYQSKRAFLAHGNCDESKPPPQERSKRKIIVNCDVCGKGFNNRMHHEEHMRSHTGERPFQCVECGKGFASKRSLRNHSHDGPAARDRPFLCCQCPAKFATAFMLKTHSRTHTDEKPWVCAECGKGYRSQHVLIDHQNQHRGIKAHVCKECGKKFTWRTSLWAHTREHARDKPFECVQCGVTFAEQLELKEHWVEHSDDKPYQCSECGLGFLLEDDRDKHMETHSKEATHMCPVCNESFTRADILAQHSHVHKEPKTCLCPHCGKTFSNKGHLKVHMMIHSGEKPFECETCHKRFYTRSLLRKHAVFHSNERPFGCTLCGDRFPTQGILNAHIRTHTGEKPFTCTVCGKSFTQSTYLKRHSLTHSGVRPHPCTVCDSAFTSRYDLKIHMRVHTGEKPYSCDDCTESFYERSALTIHRRVHTGEQPFKCDQCDRGFNTSNHVKKHFTRMHPDIAPFACGACSERFNMCEELRKHRRRVHMVSNAAGQPERVSDVTSQVSKDPLECLIKDSEILQDDPPLPEHEIQHFEVPGVVDGGAIVDAQMVEMVPASTEGLPLNMENVEVYHSSSAEYGQILRSSLLR